jgi:class 3 adenylate cyclase
MRRRDKAVKKQRRKTLTRRNAPKAARRRSPSGADQETEVARLTRELREMLEQQTATSEVLNVISSSRGELQLVFESMLENAVRICEAKFGILYRCEGDALRTVAMHGAPRPFIEARRRNPIIRPSPDTALGRAVATKQPVQIADILEELNHSDARAAQLPKLAGARSVLAIPMVKENELIGATLIYRQEVRPFTDKQIDLAKSFAAQAVIAIENARLLNELRESLEQQTATSEVLKVISNSPGELEPVFQAMLENAVRICGAKFGNLWLREGDAFRIGAMHDAPAAYADYLRREPVIHPAPGTALGQVARTRKVADIADVRLEGGHADSPAWLGTELADARTVVAVPMLKDQELIGAIVIYRREVRPFSNKQIELVKNFAAQAVIAIENARLLSDLNRLNQQLEQRVADQVSEIERMGRLRRFLPPQVADLIVASGTEKRLESHRREITALFCDLRGFTGFSEKSDPEDVMSLLREYHAAIGAIIIKYSGTLEHYAGDGVMVFFNDPIPVPNPALQAVQTALEMRMAIEALTEKWRRLGHELGFGVGIAHGFATLGTIGFEGRFDYAAIGTVSNVASRLCDEAKPGQILISPRVLMAVEDAVNVEPVGDFTLKGISRPVVAYNVLSAVSAKI